MKTVTTGQSILSLVNQSIRSNRDYNLAKRATKRTRSSQESRNIQKEMGLSKMSTSSHVIRMIKDI